jgi:formamidopyrimidine-DNA glycosylase
MPALPEVETFKRGLETEIIRTEIIDTIVGDSKVLQFPMSQLDTLIGQRFGRLSRRGKYLIFSLSRNLLIIHLGMTGQLTLKKPDRQDSEKFLRHPVTRLQRIRQHAPDKHTHLQICLEDGRTLMFRDTRKFGKVFILPRSETDRSSFFSRLGMEPLSKEYQLERFMDHLKKRKAPIKPVLLDQRFIAGIGNIYADEALFEAGVHPGKRIRYLTRKEKKRIFSAIPQVLVKGIQFGGTTLRDYIDSDGREGNHQDFLNVYGRNGQPCYSCGTQIKKTVIGQRGTHFCPRCQKRR